MSSIHSFHIPVMGTGFTLDTPILVAKYGISSVLSLVDDHLIETVREHYCQQFGETYDPIPDSHEDARALRITAYLDLISRIVERQMEALRTASFIEGSEITQYFELLSDESDLKKEYQNMLALPEGAEKKQSQDILRNKLESGSVDVNIMTKQQRQIFKKGQALPLECSDTFTALRGFAQSKSHSSVVFSAGLNPPLYSYVSEFDSFFPDAQGKLDKKIILKVSDFRSALIQGKIFAKKGLWVSEYRVESGLNCGGHAFPTAGLLLGPILETFRQKRSEMLASLTALYHKALNAQGRNLPATSPEICITVQGGIGTSGEDKFLRRYYDLARTGWGTPFLMVPEATSVDEETLAKLTRAEEDDVYLSGASPLGVPYYNLRNSESNKAREERLPTGQPGTPCFTKMMTFNNEFSEQPLCVASTEYQKKKITELQDQGLTEENYQKAYGKVVEKECICHNLGGVF